MDKKASLPLATIDGMSDEKNGATSGMIGESSQGGTVRHSSIDDKRVMTETGLPHQYI